MFNIPDNAEWVQRGVTVTGGNGPGNASDQIFWPCGICLDDNNKTLVVADSGNHRIMQWRMDDIKGQLVAGGNGQGVGLDQLSGPTDVLIDVNSDSFIICDQDNQRVVRWSCRNDATKGEVLVKNIACNGLAMDDYGYLYISDDKHHAVRRLRIGDTNLTIVAGGNGCGGCLQQLNGPSYLCVDRQQAIYVCDNGNDRIMKWNRGAKQGIVVAGGQGRGDSLAQLYWPNGLAVDKSGILYIADSGNHRVMRWFEGAKQGNVILGGNDCGSRPDQFNYVRGLSFDRFGNCYVADYRNHRIQRFSLV